MPFYSEPVTMWSDRRLVLRKSAIHGSGLFALEPIAIGECLFRVDGGLFYSSEDWPAIGMDADRYNEEQIGPNLFRAIPKTPFYYANHSCDPNCLNHYAFRAIAAGEEITCDYAYSEAAPDFVLEPCRCGTALCRGRVTGDDWRLPALQARYRGYFSPYVETLIQESQRRGAE